MNAAAAQRYRQVGVETASPGLILLALYDGAIRFGREAAEAIRKGDLSRKGERIGRMLAIVGELQSTMNRDAAPELCAKLHQLYDYAALRLELANRTLDAKIVEEVLALLETLREGWRGAVAQTMAAGR